MPFDKSRYPDNWREISLARREAARQKCEWCHAPNGEMVTRAPGGFWASVERYEDENDAWNDEEEIVWRDKHGKMLTAADVAAANGVGMEYGPEGFLVPDCRLWQSKVVLTVAHTDLDGGDKHDKHNLNGLRALCQSCHLNYDHADHIRHARETRMKRRAAGSLFEVSELFVAEAL